MAEPTALDLNFGHLGIASYDLENSDWVFTRDPQQKWFLELGEWKETVPPASRHPTPYLVKYSTKLHQATKSLIRDYAHIAPAGEHLANLEMVSAAATSAAEAYDAIVGDLLSFGTIACDYDFHHQPKAVCASATGEVGNILRLQVTSKQRYGWGFDRRGTCLEAPSLTGNESGYWNEEATPIQQICFAQTDQRSTFLAARLLSRTVIFQPTYMHSAEATRSRYFELPPSRIDPNPILSVTNEQTGNIPHADVSFNPDYQRQFGIIDQRGNWSIWDIDDGFHMSKYTLNRSVAGKITFSEGGHDDADQDTDASREDGWGRILWVGDANTVVVANRRQLSLFNLKKGSTPMDCPNLIAEESADWILDVRRHPSNEKYCFVLTSTRLVLLGVTCPSDGFEGQDTDSGGSVIVSWLHYRSTEDITLQMCAQSSADGDCLLTMHSRLNHLSTLYLFNREVYSESLSSATSGPVIVNMKGLGEMQKSMQLHQMRLDYLSFAKSHRISEHNLGELYEEKGVKFYRLSVLLSDLSVHETLFYSFGDLGQRHLQVEPISWTHTNRPRPCTGKNIVNDSDVDDDFIVPDGLADTEVPRLKSPQEPPQTIQRQSQPNTWYISDQSMVYHALGHSSLPDDQAATPRQAAELAECVDEIKQILFRSPEQPPLDTLLECLGVEISVEDIFDASADMHDLFPGKNRNDLLKLQRLASDNVLGLTETEGQDISTVLTLYDIILKNWIAPLSAEVPVPVRQRQEKLARRIAAEVVLATTRFRRDPLPEPLSLQPSSSQQDIAPALSPLTPPSSLTTFSLQLQSSLPTISESTFILPSEPKPVSNPFSRLSKHLHIETASTSEIPRGISQVLTHWQTGSDPSTYDWEATEDAAEDQEVASNSELNAAREKSRRRKQRQEKRQKREDDLFKHRTSSQPQVLRSSPGPMFSVPMSTPAQPLGSSQVQSLAHPGFGVQSQVEPGKHGSRPIKKKKGKRMSGF